MNDPLAWTVASIPVAIALYVWTAASLSAVFRKAGQEPWKAWVPILNAVVLLQLGGMSGWFLVLGLIPVLGTLALLGVFIIVYVRLNRSFGVASAMAIVAVLLLPVWTSIIGWGPARWLGDRGGSQGGLPRRGDVDSLDARVAGRTGGSQPSYAPRYSPSPIDGAPGFNGATSASSDDAPAEQWSFAPAPSIEYDSGPVRPPTFRSTAVGVNPAFDDMDDDGTGAARFVPPPPVSSAPGVRDEGPRDPWAPPPTAVPASPMRRASWAPTPDGDFDTSAEVSAVQGAPRLGEPLAARGSVSAQHGVPEIPDSEAAFDETIIVARRRPAWMLTPPLGAPIAVTADALIIGRRPAADPDFPDAQLVPISDETRTMSKTHARLELLGNEWVIVDLDSTNGVVLFSDDGAETEATPGVPERVNERFLLGDAELRLVRADSR